MERWRIILEFPAYAASTPGRIRRAQPGIGNRSRVGRVLTPTLNRRTGYYSVSLNRDRKQYRRDVHRLVAAAFLGPCPPGSEVNHRDGDKTNNRSANLEYVTRAHNIRHAMGSGRLVHARGPRQHMTRAQVERMRARYHSGHASLSELSRESGISLRAVIAAVRRQTWKHVP